MHTTIHTTIHTVQHALTTTAGIVEYEGGEPPPAGPVGRLCDGQEGNRTAGQERLQLLLDRSVDLLVRVPYIHTYIHTYAFMNIKQ